jgi:hypothetical protein
MTRLTADSRERRRPKCQKPRGEESRNCIAGDVTHPRLQSRALASIEATDVAEPGAGQVDILEPGAAEMPRGRAFVRLPPMSALRTGAIQSALLPGLPEGRVWRRAFPGGRR